MASIFKRKSWVGPDGKRCSKDAPGAKWKVSKVYSIQLVVEGRQKLFKGYTDKGATEQLAAKLERQKAQGGEGLIDPYALHKKRPLAEHIDDYVADLRALGRDHQYVYNIEKRLAKLIEQCGWRVLTSITADSFGRWREVPIVQKQVEAGGDGRIGPRTINQYHQTLRSFCQWCVKRKRLATNPLDGIELIDGTADVRRERRALTAEQLVALLDVIPERHKLLYRFVMATGLRRQEAMDVRWGDVRLDSATPYLALRAAATKARRADELPLRSDLAELLRIHRGDAGDDAPVFKSIPKMAKHRAYLKAAGIPWKDCDGRRADFHSLRHSFGTLLSKAGVSPREAMALMRHTDIKLTMRTYTDARIFDLSRAVEKLPTMDVKTVEAAALRIDGKMRSECVSSQSALLEDCLTASGKRADQSEASLTLDNGGDRQQKTPSGRDGPKAGELGFEGSIAEIRAILNSAAR